MIATSADLAGDPNVISRAEAVRPAVEAASNEIEETRRLPPALLDKLHEARLFRLLLPRSSNGIETDPMTFFHVIETIARGDASTAWCLSKAGGSPRLDGEGRPQERTMLVRTGDVTWTDIWNTVGLRGTASDQFALTDFFVRTDHSITREFDRECREGGPLY